MSGRLVMLPLVVLLHIRRIVQPAVANLCDTVLNYFLYTTRITKITKFTPTQGQHFGVYRPVRIETNYTATFSKLFIFDLFHVFLFAIFLFSLSCDVGFSLNYFSWWRIKEVVTALWKTGSIKTKAANRYIDIHGYSCHLSMACRVFKKGSRVGGGGVTR
jgi:hypothetical protein